MDVAQKRILIVDDETKVSFFLGEGLRGLGDDYEVQVTASAEQALEQMRHRPFDLVVVDLRLPGASGLDLIRWIGQRCPHTRTVLITAYGSPAVEEEARRLRTYRYLTKPFHIEELMHTVREALAR